MLIRGDEVELPCHANASLAGRLLGPDIWAGEPVGRLMDEGLDELLSDFDMWSYQSFFKRMCNAKSCCIVKNW